MPAVQRRSRGLYVASEDLTRTRIVRMLVEAARNVELRETAADAAAQLEIAEALFEMAGLDPNKKALAIVIEYLELQKRRV